MTKSGAIQLDATVVVTTDQISCDLANESVILNLSDGVYYGLNSVASRVWGLVQQPRSVREIRDLLLEEYDVKEEACTLELLGLLEQLREWKLLQLENGRIKG